jgi:hypothetical protein
MIKAFSTIVMAVCLLSQLALSAGTDSLAEDAVGKNTRKLPERDRAELASTSNAMKEAVDAHASPKDVLTSTVNRIVEKYEGNKSLCFYDIPLELEKMTVPNVPVNDFVMVKIPDHIHVREDRARFMKKLEEMKDTILSSAHYGDRSRSSLDEEIWIWYTRMRINVYANLHKYSPSEIIACMNNVYTKIKRECILGAVVRRSKPFVVLHKESGQRTNVWEEFDITAMFDNCAAYSFMCGVSYVPYEF